MVPAAAAGHDRKTRGLHATLAMVSAVGDIVYVHPSAEEIMSAFSQRVLEAELMDQPGLDERLHRRALSGLRRLNWWSSIGDYLWSAISARIPAERLNRLRILDLACGGGDVALDLVRRCQNAGASVTLDGWDKSPTAVAYATERAARLGFKSVTFLQHDVLQDPIPCKYDAVLSTLFLHHLPTADVVTLLRRMREASDQLVVVDDLRRTRLGYWLAWGGCRLLSRSPVVHADGPMSVRAAFSIAELRALAEQAGLTGASFKPHWPQRCLLTWERP